MNKLYTFAVLIAMTFFLVSFSTNPPDGYTGAPGDHFCGECHPHSNPPQNGTISVEGFPSMITPNETYLLTAVNRLDTGTAVRAGFQVTILSPTNTKAGNMASPSQSSIVSITGGRQYWDHNPAVLYPDSGVVKWTVLWTAPELPGGSLITWYAAGNIANGNFQNTGDRTVSANGSGSIVSTATEEIRENNPLIYPNPGSEQINILFSDQTAPDGKVFFYNLSGEMVGEAEVKAGSISTPLIPSGVYLLQITVGNRSHLAKWTKI